MILTGVQRSWREKAQALGRALAEDASAADVVIGAARAGLLDAQEDLVAAAIAVEALACESAAAGMALALHAPLRCWRHPTFGTARWSAADDERSAAVGCAARSSARFRFPPKMCR